VESLSAKAKQIGASIASGIDMVRAAFADGHIWELVKLGLKVAFAEAVNSFVAMVINAAGSALFNFMKSGLIDAVVAGGDACMLSTPDRAWKE